VSMGNPDKKYQKQEKIGSGASGSVFTAIEVNTGAEGKLNDFNRKKVIIFSCYKTNEFESATKERINYQ